MPLRPVTAEDRDHLVALVRHPEVARSLSVLAEASLAGALDRVLAGADDEGVLVVEDEHGTARGVVRWQTHNRRSRIAGVHGLVVDPGARGRGLATRAVADLARHLVADRGFHRVEAETYGFNEPARRAFLRAGFTAEGVRRRAYDRHGAWQDGALFGLLAEELG